MDDDQQDPPADDAPDEVSAPADPPAPPPAVAPTFATGGAFDGRRADVPAAAPARRSPRLLLVVAVVVLAVVIAIAVALSLGKSKDDDAAPAGATTVPGAVASSTTIPAGPTTTASTVPPAPTTGPPVSIVGGPASAGELSGILLTANNLALLRKAGQSATWQSVGVVATSDMLGTLSPGGCGREAPAPATWAQAEFRWVGTDQMIHGQASSLVMHFTDAAQARAYVDSRRTAAYRSCDQQATTAQISTAMPGAPIQDTIDQVGVTPVADGVALRYSADFNSTVGRCTQLKDSYWVAAGNTVVTASMQTCDVPFDDAQERALIQVQLAVLAR